jgi:hypothetical protein
VRTSYEIVKIDLEANPVDQGSVSGHIKGKSAGNQENSPQLFHHGGTRRR